MKVVITGAADGIGKALAALYTTNGHTVIGVDFDAAQAQKTQAQLGEGLSFVIADLSQQAQLDNIAEQLGTGIDVLIHNAGISAVGYFEKTDIDKQHRVIDVNFLAPMLLTRHLLARNALTV
ncbi:MAG: SDR family NAD(P)-dependent oxidoreductase, partial [Chloroflexota bacterium]